MTLMSLQTRKAGQLTPPSLNIVNSVVVIPHEYRRDALHIPKYV